MIILVNGKKIPLTEFPTDFIKNTICGMLKSLKGVDEINEVEIKIILGLNSFIICNSLDILCNR